MSNKRRTAQQWLLLLAGVILTATPFSMFFVPNDIAPGGITGLATLLHSLTGLPVGLLAALLNAPLFLISWRRLGRTFAVKSLLCMLGVSLVIDMFPIGVVTSDPILASVFGGVMMGAGVGLVIRGGATTGGTDMAAMLIHERFPVITVGGVLLALDFCVIAASGIVYSIQSALYALIAAFLTTQVMDRVVEGFESAKAFFVFSAKTQEIADAVMRDLERGVTLLHAQGAFMREESDVLLCVVTRLQVPQFKTIVRDIDEGAFVMVTDVREALGEGFTRPAE
ncbi:YitT family protein [Eubacteriales bacterium OttesenSCG-928-A19]|nr:YitT family protein [Eubacteriales bacterium OttesenSCG-928-A19]